MGKDYASMSVDQLSEEVNTRNVLAVIEYSKSTRELLAKADKQIEWLTREITTLRNEVQNLTSQVGFMRGQILGGGPTT